MWSSKYSEDIKKKVLEMYLHGEANVAKISKKYGIPASTIKNWISLHWEEEQARAERSKAASRRKRRFVDGKELRVIRPTSGSAYIDWRRK